MIALSFYHLLLLKCVTFLLLPSTTATNMTNTVTIQDLYLVLMFSFSFIDILTYIKLKINYLSLNGNINPNQTSKNVIIKGGTGMKENLLNPNAARGQTSVIMNQHHN